MRSETDEANVEVAASNDSSAQRWFITGESGAYYLRAVFESEHFKKNQD